MPIARVHRQIGVELSAEEIARLIEPIGFTVMEDTAAGAHGSLVIEVPTNRPDVRPEPFGVDDIIEEIARAFGYSNVPRHVPTWPQPGGLTALQRSRRLAKDVLCGLGVSEGWTDSFVSAAEHRDVGLTGPAVRVANPLDAERPYLRRSLMPGLLGALAYNAGRRQPDVRLFEVGVVFSHPDEGSPRVVERAGAGGRETAALPGERELLSAVFARTATTPAWPSPRGRCWPTPSVSTGFAWSRRAARCRRCPVCTRRAPLTWRCRGGRRRRQPRDRLGGGDRPGRGDEVRPHRGGRQRHRRPPRRLARGRPGPPLRRRPGAPPPGGRRAVSRFPSSDIDLAFVVDDRSPADAVADSLRAAAGDLLVSVRLFDVYRGAGITEGARSLAYRLRFCSPERTLTDEEVGDLRARCIEAVEKEYGAVLR